MLSASLFYREVNVVSVTAVALMWEKIICVME